jgi:hypothetical protein
MSSAKRKRDDEQSVSSDMDELQALSDIEYDRAAIDALVEAYTQGTAPRDEPPSTGARPEMHCCPRAYEDDFLREPFGNERACGRDQKCEGLRLQGTPGFVVREFTYPGVPLGETRGICILCRRLEISTAFFKSETGNADASPAVQIADHYNLVDVPGEYDVRDCIVSGKKYTGLQLPVVLHVRSAYTCHTKDGVRRLSQSRMRCPFTGDSLEQGPFLGRRAALVKQAAHSENSHQDASS